MHALWLFVSVALGSAVDLPRTGQDACYEDYDSDAGQLGDIVECTGTGQDGEYQAGRAWPEPRFVVQYCDSKGPCADQKSDCDGHRNHRRRHRRAHRPDVDAETAISARTPGTGRPRWTSPTGSRSAATRTGPFRTCRSCTASRTRATSTRWVYLSEEGFSNPVTASWASTTSAYDTDTAIYVAVNTGWAHTSPQVVDQLRGVAGTRRRQGADRAAAHQPDRLLGRGRRGRRLRGQRTGRRDPARCRLARASPRRQRGRHGE